MFRKLLVPTNTESAEQLTLFALHSLCLFNIKEYDKRTEFAQPFIYIL